MMTFPLHRRSPGFRAPSVVVEENARTVEQAEASEADRRGWELHPQAQHLHPQAWG